MCYEFFVSSFYYFGKILFTTLPMINAKYQGFFSRSDTWYVGSVFDRPVWRYFLCLHFEGVILIAERHLNVPQGDEGFRFKIHAKTHDRSRMIQKERLTNYRICVVG